VSASMARRAPAADPVIVSAQKFVSIGPAAGSAGPPRPGSSPVRRMGSWQELMSRGTGRGQHEDRLAHAGLGRERDRSPARSRGDDRAVREGGRADPIDTGSLRLPPAMSGSRAAGRRILRGAGRRRSGPAHACCTRACSSPPAVPRCSDLTYGLVASQPASGRPLAAPGTPSSKLAKLGYAASMPTNRKRGPWLRAERAQGRTTWGSGRQPAPERSEQPCLLFTWSGRSVTSPLASPLGWSCRPRATAVGVITEDSRRAPSSTSRAARPDRGPGRVKELADTFDGMLERLDAGGSLPRRRLVPTASHEIAHR